MRQAWMFAFEAGAYTIGPRDNGDGATNDDLEVFWAR